MKISKLLVLLQSVDPDLEVVVPGSDHSYTKVRFANVVDAEELHGEHYEYYDDRNMFEGGQKTKVFLID